MKRLDQVVPAEFVEQFGDIAQGFLTPCTRLMKKIKGPRYTPPVFQNIKLAPIPPSTQPEIIDMTQPSQHVPHIPVFGDVSSSRPQKLPTTRGYNPNKWDIKKPLNPIKMEKISIDWGFGDGWQPTFTNGISPLGFKIYPSAMRTLAPGRWIDDRIILVYSV